MIPTYARSNFDIKDTDSKAEILNKRYFLYRDKIGREFQEQERQRQFEKKYNEIKSMRGKTTIESLKLQLAIEEILDEYK
jgi:hypothetical protein